MDGSSQSNTSLRPAARLSGVTKEYPFGATTVGALGLARPTEVVVVNAEDNLVGTAELLADAHRRAARGETTLVHQMSVPSVGYENTRATDVRPDFAIVALTVDRATLTTTTRDDREECGR